MSAAVRGGSADRWLHRPGGPAVRLAAAVILLVLAALGSAARGVTHLSTAGMLAVGADPVTFIAGAAFVVAACLVLAGVLALLVRRRRRRPDDGFARVLEPVAPWWVRALVTLAALALIALPSRPSAALRGRRGQRVAPLLPVRPVVPRLTGRWLPGPGRRRLPARCGGGRAGGGRAGGDGAVAAPPAAGGSRAARQAARPPRWRPRWRREAPRSAPRPVPGKRSSPATPRWRTRWPPRVTAPGRRHPGGTAEPRRGRRDHPDTGGPAAHGAVPGGPVQPASARRSPAQAAMAALGDIGRDLAGRP